MEKIGERYGFFGRRCTEPGYTCYKQRNEVLPGNNIDIVAHHFGYVGDKHHRSSTGIELLKCRETRLVKYILESPELALGKIEQCLAGAFEKMDKDLEDIVKMGNCPKITLQATPLWMTRFNSLIVIVDRTHQRVHVAGSGQVQVLLLDAAGNKTVLTQNLFNAHAELKREQVYRPSKLSPDVVLDTKECLENEDGSFYYVPLPIKEHKQLFFYNQAPLGSEHEHVFLAPDDFLNDKIWMNTGSHYEYVDLVDLPKHFQSMGLKEALREAVMRGPNLGRIDLLLVLRLRLNDRKRCASSATPEPGTSAKFLKGIRNEELWPYLSQVSAPGFDAKAMVCI